MQKLHHFLNSWCRFSRSDVRERWVGRGDEEGTELHRVDDEQARDTVLVGCVALEDNDSNATENFCTMRKLL